jgi:hypothetical protein
MPERDQLRTVEPEGALRAAADRSLARTEQGRAILKRRGFSSTDIERMQRPS